MNGNHFLNTDLLLASGNSFSSSWKPFSSSVSDVVQGVLHPHLHFLVQKKKYCFLFWTFFPASQYHYLNYSEFKTLITAIGNDFIWFFRYSCQRKKFFCLVETYSETCSPFLLMETDFLSTWINTPLLGDLFLLVDTIGEIQFLKDNLMSASGNWFSGK